MKVSHDPILIAGELCIGGSSAIHRELLFDNARDEEILMTFNEGWFVNLNIKIFRALKSPEGERS